MYLYTCILSISGSGVLGSDQRIITPATFTGSMDKYIEIVFEKNFQSTWRHLSKPNGGTVERHTNFYNQQSIRICRLGLKLEIIVKKLFDFVFK